MVPRTVREDIEYHIDKGITQRMLLEDMVERSSCASGGGGGCPNPHNMGEVERELEAMVADGTVTRGKYQGCEDFLVVSAWRPNTAALMKGEPSIFAVHLEGWEPTRPLAEKKVRIRDSDITMPPVQVGRIRRG